jgi:hypothetical protein
VLEVVGVEEADVRAGGEGAAAVAEGESAAEGGGDGARAAAEIEPGAGGGVMDGEDAAVAGQPAKRLRGDARAVVQGGREGALGCEWILIDVEDDLVAERRGVVRDLGRGHVGTIRMFRRRRNANW